MSAEHSARASELGGGVTHDSRSCARSRGSAGLPCRISERETHELGEKMHTT